MKENITDGPLELRVAKLETPLAALSTHVASLEERLDEQDIERLSLEEQIPIALKERLDILEADLRDRKDAEERKRLMHEACRQAESKETDAQPGIVLETLDLESLSQQLKESCDVMYEIETGKRQDPWEYATDHHLGTIFAITEEMEKRFPEELEALQASADWRGSPAWIAAQNFESLKQWYQRTGDILNSIPTGKGHDKGNALADHYLSNLDAVVKEMKKRFPEEFKTLARSNALRINKSP